MTRIGTGAIPTSHLILLKQGWMNIPITNLKLPFKKERQKERRNVSVYILYQSGFIFRFIPVENGE